MSTPTDRAPTFDVWFKDEGRWELDTANVTAERAAEIIAELRETGYLGEARPHVEV